MAGSADTCDHARGGALRGADGPDHGAPGRDGISVQVEDEMLDPGLIPTKDLRESVHAVLRRRARTSGSAARSLTR